jgi:hypothetical protein
VILIERVSRVSTELFMAGNKEDVALMRQRGGGARGSKDGAHDVCVRAVIVILRHRAELIGLEEVSMELQSLVYYKFVMQIAESAVKR